ncbi:hypothetical protein GCM10022234_21850 [Aeromicrobium panaciterrae]
MSVATMLGVDDVDAPAMMEARVSWSRWASEEPALADIADLLELRGWTRQADLIPRDAAIRALAKLGSPTGGNEQAATTALTWALVPGATNLARRLADLNVSANVNALIASHLWTSAKTFKWEHRTSAASAILHDTRHGVLGELGLGDRVRRKDRTWARTICVEPDVPIWADQTDERIDDAEFVVDLLDNAILAGVISVPDRSLLIDLAIAADIGCVPAGRGRAGLTGSAATQVVAQRRGQITRTVARRASRAIDRLATYSNGFDNLTQVLTVRGTAPDLRWVA